MHKTLQCFICNVYLNADEVKADISCQYVVDEFASRTATVGHSNQWII